MKLGEGGEAFFVFETKSNVPLELQTSPLVSPETSPRTEAERPDPGNLSEPEYLDINASDSENSGRGGRGETAPPEVRPSPLPQTRPQSGDWSPLQMEQKSASEEVLPTSSRRYTLSHSSAIRPRSPDHAAAVEKALELSKKLSENLNNIPTQITDKGDIMLDITGYKTGEDETLRAENIARKILAEEMDGVNDIGGLISADNEGNVWIYSSEESKEEHFRQTTLRAHMESVSDGGYSSDSGRSDDESKVGPSNVVGGLATPPTTPPLPSDPAIRKSQTEPASGSHSRNYAKTLRLTSAQLKSLNLKPGSNTMSFTVNKATVTGFMYLWKYDVPVVISDIDGTITKSDALGHVMTMIGRDWTHLGVAKLYTDIVANGYNIMYLTSRSVGQADTTRNYLNGIVQDSYKVPKGPVIMSPDRTMAALRREVYLRKPEVFKMACLRDILNLFGKRNNPFYAGFGNRLTDALSYRSVNIPSTRIFTINSYAEVSLDLLTLTKYKSSYVSMRDLVDHFFPPVNLHQNEEFTDFSYWREPVPEIIDSDLEDSDEELDEEDEIDEDEEEMMDEEADDEEGYSDEEEGDADLYADEMEDESGVDSMMASYMTSYTDPASLEQHTRLAELTEEAADVPVEEAEEDKALEEDVNTSDVPEAEDVEIAMATPIPVPPTPEMEKIEEGVEEEKVEENAEEKAEKVEEMAAEEPEEKETVPEKKDDVEDTAEQIDPTLAAKIGMKIDMPAVTGMLGQLPEFLKEEGSAIAEKVGTLKNAAMGSGDHAEDDLKKDALDVDGGDLERVKSRKQEEEKKEGVNVAGPAL